MTSNRLDFIVPLRVIAMTLVVFYHCLCVYNPIWGSISVGTNDCYVRICHVLNCVHVPLFFCVSGYLFAYLYCFKGKYRQPKEFIKVKIIRLIIPYLFWGVVVLLTTYHFYKPVQLLQGISHLWFLQVLFNIFVVAFLMRRLLERLDLKLDILIGLTLFAFANMNVIPFRWLGLMQTAKMAIYFYTGCIIAKYALVDKWGGQRAVYQIIIFVISLMGLVVSELYGYSLFSGHGRILNAVNQVFTLSMLFNSIMLASQIHKVPSQLMKSLDENGMGIYLIHHIIIQGSLQISLVRLWYTEHDVLAPLICFVIVYALSYALSSFIRQTKLSFVLG